MVENKGYKGKKLEVGTKYLTIVIQFLGQKFKIAAFKNPAKAENPKAPNFIGQDVAVWISEKQAPKQKQEGMDGLF